MKIVTRRDFLKTASLATAGVIAAPYLSLGGYSVSDPLTRPLGRTGFQATTLGLGGQGSLQWTPQEAQPVEIILKALELGVNYIDTSNIYGKSQAHFGEAFRRINVVPGLPGYDERRRNGLFVATKSMIRHAKGTRVAGVAHSSSGGPQATAVSDVKRSLSLMFGDGQGGYPAGAYLDCVQVHSLDKHIEVEAIYQGLENPDPKDEQIGALAGLLDFRDGTNRTGLNPREEKLIRHIGLTGHWSSPVLMDCIQRDSQGVFDTLLVAVNANDRLYLNHQYNVVPVAAAKGIGVIGMKVFSNGAMYERPANWSEAEFGVVKHTGTRTMPAEALIEYTLTTPGVDICIVGIGKIDTDPKRCQLEYDLRAAQIDMPSSDYRRLEIENLAHEVKQGRTNYFQVPRNQMIGPKGLKVVQVREGNRRRVSLNWQTAIAGDQPLKRYEILVDGRMHASTPHSPQTDLAGFRYEDMRDDHEAHTYMVAAIDNAGRHAESEEVFVEATL